MKLTKRYRQVLTDLEIPEEDWQQISEAAAMTTITLFGMTGIRKKISRNTAQKLPGTEVFFYALHRSAFHLTSCRETPSGDIVHFDSGKYFKTRKKQ